MKKNLLQYSKIKGQFWEIKWHNRQTNQWTNRWTASTSSHLKRVSFINLANTRRMTGRRTYAHCGHWSVTYKSFRKLPSKKNISLRPMVQCPIDESMMLGSNHKNGKLRKEWKKIVWRFNGVATLGGGGPGKPRLPLTCSRGAEGSWKGERGQRFQGEVYADSFPHIKV